jgi:hypothetical protein
MKDVRKKQNEQARGCLRPLLFEHLAHHAVVWLRASLHGQDETARVGGVMEDAAKQNKQSKAPQMDHR